MANWQVISLDTVTPQLRAPGTGDGYSFNSGSTQLGVWTTTGLGIGTASPAAKLVVSNAGAAGIEFFPTGGVGGGPYYLAINRSTTTFIHHTNYASAHTWYVSTAGNVRAMDLDTSGNLGIGTSSPNYLMTIYKASLPILQIVNSTSGSGASDGLLMYLNGADATLSNEESGYLRFQTAGTERAVINSSGNLGLGVTPSAWSVYRAFDIGRGALINASTETDLVHNAYWNGSNWIYKVTDFASRHLQINGQHRFFTAPSGTANTTTITNGVSYTIITSGNQTSFGAANNNVGTVFTATSSGTLSSGTVSQNISWSQAMTLDASGNLGVGVTSPNARLDVVGSAGIRVNEDGASTKVIQVRSNFAGVGPAINVATNDLLLLQTNNTERVRIPAAGGMVVGTAALATNATDGFLYIPGCAGTPTGTPTALTGRVPLVVDTTNNKLYFYSGGAWRDAGP